MKKYSSLHLFQIDLKKRNLKKKNILDQWNNLDKDKKEIYKKISKSIKLKTLENNNSIDELGFLKIHYMSKIKKEEYRKNKEILLNKLMNNVI